MNILNKNIKIIAYHSNYENNIIYGDPYFEYSDIVYVDKNFYNIIKNIININKDFISPKSLFIDVNDDVNGIINSLNLLKKYNKFIADVWFIYRINRYNIDFFNKVFSLTVNHVIDLQSEPKIILDVSQSDNIYILKFLKKTLINDSLAELVIFDYNTETRFPIIHVFSDGKIIVNRSLISNVGEKINVKDIEDEIEKRHKILNKNNLIKINMKNNFNITRFGSFVFEITRECNLKCLHCYVSCSPLHNKIHLKYDKIVEVIDDARNIPEEVVDRRVSLAGGEATLPKFFELTLGSLKHAKSNGFMAELVSNGYFALMGKTYIDKLVDVLDMLELSLSPFHLAQIDNDSLYKILYALNYIASRHIYTVIRYQTTLANRLDILYKRAGSKIHGLRILTSPVISLGRADLRLRDQIARKPLEVLTNTCWTNLNVTINYDGSVTPCCAGSELMKYMKYGNIYDESIVDIVNRMVSDPYLYVLTHFGPQRLLLYIKETKPELFKKYKVPMDYSDICEACFYLNTRRDMHNMARSYIDSIMRKVYG